MKNTGLEAARAITADKISSVSDVQIEDNGPRLTIIIPMPVETQEALKIAIDTFTFDAAVTLSRDHKKRCLNYADALRTLLPEGENEG